MRRTITMNGQLHLLLVPLHVLTILSLKLQAQSPPPSSATDDRLALLSLKSSLTSGGSETILASWNATTNICQWLGVSCGSLEPSTNRVTSLWLPSLDLTGTISPSIGNLTFLAYLDLSGNALHGLIPNEIGFLRRLKAIDLRSNMLERSIPDELRNCSRLEELFLEENELSGNIPPWIGNSTSLLELRLSDNLLEGNIPAELGLVAGIEIIDLLSNHLSGEIPPTLFNLSSLDGLGLGFNFLSGSLPPDMGSNLPSLRSLFLYANELEGPIPPSLPNASSLLDVELGGNMFTGVVPPSIGSLSSLETLHLDGNMLGSRGTDGWSFLSSLSQCSNLTSLDISGNDFTGPLPESVGNLTANLGWLRLGGNRLSGKIPSAIRAIENLLVLDLQHNHLSGEIPDIFPSLKKMEGLSLANNKLSGRIPLSIGNLTRLTELYLNNNNLTGGIPNTFPAMQTLDAVDISHNSLTGTVAPKSVIGFSSLTILLNISHNSLVGRLPGEVGRLVNLKTLDLSHNNFSGEIPSTLKSCIVLEHLYMQSNSFSGTIPKGFGFLRGLNVLDLSRNRLSGRIPEFLEKLTSLRLLNLSYNNFEGEVPSGGIFSDPESFSIVGNRGELCGGHPRLRLKPCLSTPSDDERKRLSTEAVAIIVVVAAVVVVASLVMLHLLFAVDKKKSEPTESSTGFSWRDKRILQVSYMDLRQATGNFSQSNLIEKGGYGSIYKGRLEGREREVAVKVLDTRLQPSSKSFEEECRVTRNVRHRHILNIVSSCSSCDANGNEFKALVYDYMPNGNLHMWLHGDRERLDLFTRVDVAIHVASALQYLHHEIEKPIVHCDLKPSNVLLDASMVGYLSDFGISRFVAPSGETSTISVRGSIGYIAPECATGSEISPLWDVYSFGVLLLEMFTGMDPTDESLQLDDLSLQKYVKICFPEKIEDVLDANILRCKSVQMDQKIRDCLVAIIEIALVCSNELPKERMSIKEALGQLENIRKRLFDVSAL